MSSPKNTIMRTGGACEELINFQRYADSSQAGAKTMISSSWLPNGHFLSSKLILC